MEKKVGSGLGVVAILSLLVYSAFPPTPQPGASAAETKKEQKQQAAKANGAAPQALEGPWLATREFFAGSAAKLPELDSQSLRGQLSGVGGVDLGLARDLLGAPASGYDVQNIIATVANPVHTHLPLLFDQQIEAIEGAAERNGWEFAGQWLPWNISSPATDDTFAERLGERALEREQEALPGVLVFRHSPMERFENKCLLVFLTPEAPTTGIVAAPFNAAMNLALAMGGKIGLLAPSFSGSFESLTRLVNMWQKQPGVNLAQYTVYSGTASSSKRANFFRAETKLKFQSGVTSIEMNQQGFTKVLQRYGISTEHSAYLIEGESGYARSFIADEKRNEWAGRIRTYRYPRDIANLRNAYQEATGNPSTKDNSQISLDFTLKDRSHSADTVPIFSDTHTPVVQSALLGAIARDFREKRIELVYIVATNTLDALFLARVMRKGSPDTRVMIGGADMLFVPAASQESVAGTLFLSPYSLFLQPSKTPPYDDFQIHTFPTSNFQGLFSVTEQLLAEMNGKPRDAPEFPGFWLLTVTHHGLIPLDWINRNAGNETSAGVLFPTPRPSFGWFATLIGTGLVAIFGSMLILWANLVKETRVPFWLAIHPSSPASAVALTGAGLSLSLMVWVLSLPAYETWLEIGGSRGIATILLAAAATVTPPTAILIVVLKEWQLWETARPIHKILTVGLVLTDAGLGWAWAWACYGHAAQTGLLFRLRALNLFSGTSPAAPLLILGCVFFLRFLMLFRRYSEVAWDAPTLIFKDDVKMHAMIRPHVLAVEEHLKSGIAAVDISIGSPVAWRYTAGGIAVVLCMLPLLPSLHPFEREPYTVVLELCVGLVLLGLAVACQDLVHMWQNLRGMLQLLEMSPLRGAIERVVSQWPRQAVWALWRSISRPRLAAQMLLALHNRHQSLVGAYPLLIDYTRFRRLAEARFVQMSDKRAAQHYLDLQNYEHECADLAAQILEHELVPYWDKSPLNDDGDPQVEGKEHPEDVAARYGADFFALQLCNYILFAVRHTQRLAWSISVGLLLLVLALASYHPQSPQLLGRILAVLLVGIGCVIGWVFAGMERNWVLSRIGRTEPGELNLEFYVRLASIVILPLSAVLVHLFPSLSGFLSNVITPGMEALK